MSGAPGISISYSDVERQVLDYMARLGIAPSRPSSLRFDGGLHRYHVDGDKRGTENGAYVIHPDAWPAGVMMSHKIHDEWQRWKFQIGDLGAATQKEMRAFGVSDEFKKIQRERRDREEAEAKARQEERAGKLCVAWTAYRQARPIWESPDHPYLLAKHVQPRGGFPCGGEWCELRVGAMTSTSGKQLSNLLLIPMMDVTTGRFTALHRIFGRPDTGGKFGKGWATAAGGVYPIGIDVKSGPVFAGEGIGTMLSVYDAWTDEAETLEGCTVFATMDSGNLARQAASIRERFKRRQLIVVQDDDEAGARAAQACMSAGFDGIHLGGDLGGA